MTEYRADCHTHTTCSDGTFTPEELIAHAKNQGLSAISITDHDTLDAYPKALELAKQEGIDIIPGVEFSTVHEGSSVHVLGYGFDIQNRAIHELCEWHKNRRRRRYHKILELLKKHGMPLEPEERAVLGRPHLAQSMLEKGYVTSIQEAFKKWIGEGKPCFYREEWKGVQETIDVIHEAGGRAIIAHPHLIDNSKILKALLKMSFDGIECYYAKFPISTNAKFLKIAREKNWLITGGSDFHGTVKPSNPIGSSWIKKELFQILCGP
jgi:predicted metal-dependent phosphoesterase TrpH